MNTIFITALGLSMDACAAAIMLSSKHRWSLKLFIAALSFGVFQAGMPALGYLLGLPFKSWIEPVDHWIAFLILVGLGARALFDLEKEHELEEQAGPLTYRLIGALAVATSIDAFVVGIGFHALQINILNSIVMIGVVTFLISMAGVGLGRVVHYSLASYSEKMGGVILIFLGFKILLSHLFGL